MKTIYIKFFRSDDIYAIDPFYDLDKCNSLYPKVCEKCGDTLYVPVELSANAVIEQPMGPIRRPYPKEAPNFIFQDTPDPATIELHIDGDCLVMLIEGFSTESVRHKCNET
jgi:hypothetical protein